MATPGKQLRLSLAEEATCSICRGYFAEPVSVQCGHTFCTRCITCYWEGVQGPYPCPQCRETAPTKTLHPNRHLANMVQILAKGPPVAPTVAPSGEGTQQCKKHDEKLKLFCQEDQTPICVICRESREHRTHKVRPVREVAREYQDKFQSYLGDVKRELENVLEIQRKEKAKLKDEERNFKNDREQITRVFNMVQEFLEKEKHRHLSNLEEKEKRALQEIGEKLSELDKRQASIRDQITEIELKCQLPDVEFLKKIVTKCKSLQKQLQEVTKMRMLSPLLQDVKSISSRFEQLKNQSPKPGNINNQEEGPAKDEEMKVKEEKEEGGDSKKEEQQDVEGDLILKIIESLDWRRARTYAGAVNLDPDTAHRGLVLSTDEQSVSLGEQAKDLPDTPERFDAAPCVLGRERLRSGKHYWEVEVGSKKGWYLGVCDESVSRKGAITLSPERGYCAVRLWAGAYYASNSSPIPLVPHVTPRVVGLFLDREAGRLNVYNVTDRSLLFAFLWDPIPGILRPLFCPGVSDGGKNAEPLRVLPVTGQNCE